MTSKPRTKDKTRKDDDAKVVEAPTLRFFAHDTTETRYYHLRDGSWLECDPIPGEVGMNCREVPESEVPPSVKQKGLHP